MPQAPCSVCSVLLFLVSLRPISNFQIERRVHSMTQHPLPSPFSNVSRAALVAASKTSSTPSPVRDEHSRYFRAPISCAISVASRVPTKCWDFFRISSIATGSSLKSFFRPTSIIGTPGHLSFASSTHCQEILACDPRMLAGELTLCLTLSRESGVSIEKPMRMTCAFEYARGRNRS
jgi:hypothetical protein